MRKPKLLKRSFFRPDAVSVAPLLLNKLLVRDDGRAARIVEVEAYRGSDDEAAHTFRGRTERNASMFGECGHFYVYFTYGMHWCANVVCGAEGEGTGVLLRALEPVAGLDLMHAARPIAKSARQLCNGPACLTQAMSISKLHDGADLLGGSPFQLFDDGLPPPAEPVQTPRIGISKAVDLPWRWYVPGNAFVSRK